MVVDIVLAVTGVSLAAICSHEYIKNGTGLGWGFLAAMCILSI